MENPPAPLYESEGWHSGQDPKQEMLENRYFLEVILQSQRQGKTCLPLQLGLSHHHYHELKKLASSSSLSSYFGHPKPEDDTRQELLNLRGDEWMELRDLLIGHRNRQSETEIWLAEIVAAGCLGGEHLWRDLGLPDRKCLSDLLDSNFHSLAVQNDRDMKWKKFFYKQLCEQGGGYVCRAPSCDQCKAYNDCFGPEE